MTTNYIIYHSLNYKYTTRTCSYLILYDFQGSQEFGLIQYFIESYNKFFACIRKFKKKNSSYLNDLTAKTSKKNRDLADQYLNDLYFIVEETTLEAIIEIEMIIGKCVLIKVKKDDNDIYYVTKFINEYEHD